MIKLALDSTVEAKYMFERALNSIERAIWLIERVQSHRYGQYRVQSEGKPYSILIRALDLIWRALQIGERDLDSIHRALSLSKRTLWLTKRALNSIKKRYNSGGKPVFDHFHRYGLYRVESESGEPLDFAGTNCCSVLQCAAQCVAVCCSVLQCVAQCVAVCCSVFQHFAVCNTISTRLCKKFEIFKFATKFSM